MLCKNVCHFYARISRKSALRLSGSPSEVYHVDKAQLPLALTSALRIEMEQPNEKIKKSKTHLMYIIDISKTYGRGASSAPSRPSRLAKSSS